MVLGDAVTKLQMFVWILTMFQESYLDPCSTLEHQTWSNNQSQIANQHGGVCLSISRLSKKSFVGFHMARDEGLFILDWRQFYRPKNGSVRLDQSE